MKVTLVGAEQGENLSLRYLAGALEREGHAHHLVGFDGPEDLEETADAIVAADAPITGLSMVFTPRGREFAQLATRVREKGYRGFLIAGGQFASFHPQALLREVPALDAVAIGEGEETLCELADRLEAPETVSGLVLRVDGEGGTLATGRRKPVDDLDTRAWPIRTPPLRSFHGLGIANLLGSRGCTDNCHFCSIVAWHKDIGGKRLRLRDPEHLAEEMAALYGMGVRVFNFQDDSFLLPSQDAMMERLEALEAALRARGVDPIAFAIKCRPDRVHREVTEKLVSMGLFQLFLGIEAGTEHSLAALGRTQRLEDNLRALRVVQELDVHLNFNLLMFHPESTLEDLRRNVDFLRAYPQHPVSFCRAELYAGTPLEKRMRDEGRLLGDWWWHGYEITDPQAERAWRVAFPAFYSRHYDWDGLANLVMRVDANMRILARFYGSQPVLARRVRELVVESNRNTCDWLERILEACEHDAGDPEDDVRRFQEAMREDTEHLVGRSRALLREMGEVIHRRQQAQRTWAQRASSMGLAAGVAMGAVCLPGCFEGETIDRDMAPVGNTLSSVSIDEPYGQGSTSRPAAFASPSPSPSPAVAAPSSGPSEVSTGAGAGGEAPEDPGGPTSGADEP